MTDHPAGASLHLGGNAGHQIVLISGHIILIDAADRELVESHTWHAQVTPWTVYAKTHLPRPTRGHVYLHRLILSAEAGQSVDHRNHDGLDNRRTNLRLAIGNQNHANSRGWRRSRSGYKGVHWDSHRGCWQAVITSGGQKQHLGRFEDPWVAAQAYNTAALAAFGDFAYLNTRQGAHA